MHTIDYEDSLSHIRQSIETGHYRQAIAETRTLAETALRQVLSHRQPHLSNAEQQRLLDARQKVARDQRPERLSLAQLAGIITEAGLWDGILSSGCPACSQRLFTPAALKAWINCGDSTTHARCTPTVEAARYGYHLVLLLLRESSLLPPPFSKGREGFAGWDGPAAIDPPRRRRTTETFKRTLRHPVASFFDVLALVTGRIVLPLLLLLAITVYLVSRSECGPGTPVAQSRPAATGGTQVSRAVPGAIPSGSIERPSEQPTPVGSGNPPATAAAVPAKTDLDARPAEVLVYQFHSTGPGDTPPIGAALAVLLESDLRAVGTFEVLPRGLGVPGADRRRENAGPGGGVPGSLMPEKRYSIRGKVITEHDRLDVEVKVINQAAPERVHSISVSGSMEDVVQVRDRLADQVAKAIGGIEASAIRKVSVTDDGLSWPAVQHLARIIDLVDRGQVDEAEQMFKTLADAQTGFRPRAQLYEVLEFPLGP